MRDFPGPGARGLTDSRTNHRKRLRIALTLISILVLLVWLPYESMAGIIASARADWFALAALLAATLGLLDASRVAGLLALPLTAYIPNLRITYLAALTAQLPTGLIGSDLFRGVALRAIVRNTESIASVMIISRLMSLAAVMLVFVVTAVLMTLNTGAGGRLVEDLTPALATLFAGLVALAAVVAVLVAFRHRLARYRAPVREAWSFVQTISLNRIVFAAVISLVIIGVRALTLWAAMQALSLDSSFGVVVMAISAGFILSVIPLTAAGVGPREAGIAGVLVLFGHEAGLSVLIALLFRAVALAGATGGYVLSQGLEWIGMARERCE